MTQVKYNEQAAKVIEVMSKGAFLTTAHGGKVNTMTIGWGSLGFAWGKPIFTVMVRPSRHTFQLIEASGEFTVSLPLKEGMQQALGICGSKSGRDIDKFSAAGLTAQPGKQIATPVIAGCGLHYECKIIYKQPMNPELLAPATATQCYSSGDYHTLYFGEIVATYTD